MLGNGIETKIIEWINKYDCRSYTIVRKYAEQLFPQWQEVFHNRNRAYFISMYIRARNSKQKDLGIKPPKDMTLYLKDGCLLLPNEIKIDKDKII